MRVEGKLTKRYLGRDTDLTLARLEQAAQQLWLDPKAALWQKEKRASSQPPPSSTIAFGKKVFLPDHLSEVHVLPSDVAKRSRDSGVSDGLSRGRNNGVGGWKTRVSPAISGLPTDPMLATKLHVPQPRPNLVHRPRLIQRLQQGMERALTLISAPAGFGKSTLLSDWLASQGISCAWLSLEPQDNEPGCFLSYLIAALQTYDPHLGTTRQMLHHPLQPPPLEAVLTLLINDLLVSRATAQEHLVLVLDNYQVITAESIHHTLSFLLNHLPPQMHIVLATREDPPLPLAHLRGRDNLLELRAADLRFTPQETATFLTEVMGLPLSAEESALLQARTEGWITGLQLAACSLQGRDDPAGFIAAFSGGHHYVVDYLLEEVLSRQGEAVQNFLLQTCILDRLCVPLCDAVRAQDGSRVLLDFLERANLFLVPLDDERQWYRYHHLFVEVLRQRLQQLSPTLVTELHRRASRWYEQHEFFAEAVSHALAAPALEEVARLIEQYAWVFISENQMQTLFEWLQALPETMILAHPSLCVIHAIALMYPNHLETASARLQESERVPGLGEDTQIPLLRSSRRSMVLEGMAPGGGRPPYYPVPRQKSPCNYSFGYCLVPLFSATLLRDTIVTPVKQ